MLIYRLSLPTYICGRFNCVTSTRYPCIIQIVTGIAFTLAYCVMSRLVIRRRRFLDIVYHFRFASPRQPCIGWLTRMERWPLREVKRWLFDCCILVLIQNLGGGYISLATCVTLLNHTLGQLASVLQPAGLDWNRTQLSLALIFLMMLSDPMVYQRQSVDCYANWQVCSDPIQIDLRSGCIPSS